MTPTTICMRIKRAEGALVRILGLIERRGYTIEAVSMPPSAAEECEFYVTVMPRDDSRNAEILMRQLGRIVDVVHAAPATFPAGGSGNAKTVIQMGADHRPQAQQAAGAGSMQSG